MRLRSCRQCGCLVDFWGPTASETRLVGTWSLAIAHVSPGGVLGAPRFFHSCTSEWTRPPSDHIRDAYPLSNSITFEAANLYSVSVPVASRCSIGYVRLHSISARVPLPEEKTDVLIQIGIRRPRRRTQHSPTRVLSSCVASCINRGNHTGPPTGAAELAPPNARSVDGFDHERISPV